MALFAAYNALFCAIVQRERGINFEIAQSMLNRRAVKLLGLIGALNGMFCIAVMQVFLWCSDRAWGTLGYANGQEFRRIITSALDRWFDVPGTDRWWDNVAFDHCLWVVPIVSALAGMVMATLFCGLKADWGRFELALRFALRVGQKYLGWIGLLWLLSVFCYTDYAAIWFIGLVSVLCMLFASDANAYSETPSSFYLRWHWPTRYFFIVVIASLLLESVLERLFDRFFLLTGAGSLLSVALLLAIVVAEKCYEYASSGMLLGRVSAAPMALNLLAEACAWRNIKQLAMFGSVALFLATPLFAMALLHGIFVTYELPQLSVAPVKVGIARWEGFYPDHLIWLVPLVPFWHLSMCKFVLDRSVVLDQLFAQKRSQQ